MNVPVSRYRWVILILAYFCTLGLAFTFHSLPPILTLIIEELKLSHAEAGLLMGLFALPTIFLAILTGLLLDRWGVFKIGVISLILVIIGMFIFAVGGTFLYIGLGRVIAGSGATAISMVALKMLSQWFRRREVGTAIGISNTAMPVGAIICFTTFGKLGESLGWRMPIFISVMIGIVGLAAFLILYKPAPDLPQKIIPDKGKKTTGLFSNLLKIEVSIWLIGFCWMWFNASTISFLTFAPDFFISKGYSIGFAGFLISLLMWGLLILSPIIGHLIDKVNNNDVFIGVGGIILATAIYLVTRSTNFLFPMVVMAVAMGLVPVSVLSFPSKILKSENLGLSFGILLTCASIGRVFSPYIAGLIRDKTGSYEISFIFLSILALLTTLTALILRIKTRRG
ncbi:MFS transporter [Patescibacteria group bacterium]|nr:MFS transporter [Patescibacteria group bacterium]